MDVTGHYSFACMTQSDVVEAISAWAERWRDPQFPVRQEAEQSTDPFPFAHVRASLDALLDSLTADALWQLIDREGVRDAQGVPVVGHVVASNTPLLAWTSVLRALLMRSRSVVKLPSGPAAQWGHWFHNSLPPALATLVRMSQWPGTDDAQNAALCNKADALFAYGSDATILNLRALCPPRLAFFGYGHRVSVGVTDGGNADGFARDILAYDGGGCLTPQVIYVCGRAEHAARFAVQLASALAQTVTDFPLPERADGAAGRVREARALAQMEPETQVWGDKSLRWTVAARPQLEFTPSVGHGVVSVQPLPNWDALPAALSPVAGRVQGCGVGANADIPHAPLERLGVSYVCPAGKMQTPPFDWREDGRDLLRCLVPDPPAPQVWGEDVLQRGRQNDNA